ncbi:MAG: universal stress protein, partial [Dehalococcoidia bacterium]
DIAEQIVAAQREEAEKHLADAKAALEATGLKNVETVVLEGLPGDRIVEEATARGVDVVVMSTHGRSGLQRTVLGSVADHVLRHLDGVPVLLVHPAEA